MEGAARTAGPAAAERVPGCPGTSPCARSDGRLAISSCVYGWSGFVKMSRTGDTSTSFPAYMTPSRSTNWATSPMSCPTRITEASRSRLHPASVSMTCFCTTTSRALVGSSAMITLRAQTDGDGNAGPLLHAPAQFVGIHPGDLRPAARPTGGGRAPDPLLAVRKAGPHDPSAHRQSAPGCASPGSASSWTPAGIMAIRANRTRRISSSERLITLTPSSHTSPASIRPGGLIMRRMARAIVDLPDPDSPTRPSRSSGPEGEADVVGSLHRPQRGVVVHHQALDPKDVGRHAALRSRGWRSRPGRR